MAVNPQIKALELRPPKAPNLLIAPVSYSQLYVDQLNNALRLYFNQIDNFGSGLLNGTGGAGIKFPYFASYQDGNTALTGNITNNSTTPIPVTSTTGFESSGFIIIENEIIQYTAITATTFEGTITRGVKGTTNVAHSTGAKVSEAAAVTVGTAQAIRLDTVTASNGITCTVPDSKIYFDVAGLYNIQFSLQLLNYTTSEDNVTVWFKKNNVDISTSASIEQVNSKHGTSPGAAILSLNLIEQFAVGDYVELYWHSDSGNTVLATFPPGTSPVHPASPAVILTVTFVSAV
jgi:hypothetical protein